MATILFCPFSHGVGFGYIGRLLVIARSLSDAGHQCIFATDAREGLVARCGFTVKASPTKHGTAVPDMGSRQGEYIPIDNIDTAFGIARYYHASRVRHDVGEDLKVIDEVRPDLVVVDMQPTAAMAARHRKIPILSIGDSDTVRDEANSWMPWLPERAANVLPYPSCLPAFNEVLTKLGLPTVHHVSDVLWGTLTLLATAPELEGSLPPINVRGPMAYIGSVYWDPPWSDAVQSLADFGNDASCKIYITLGHGGKATSQQAEAVLQGCSRHDWAVFVSLGFRSDGGIALPPNARAGTFTGLTRPMQWADIVINHGGHGTVVASLLHGKPSIVIPFMSEQEANGLVFVEDNNAGFLLHRTLPATGSQRYFARKMRYSKVAATGDISPSEVSRAVQEIIADDRYREGARRTAQLLRGYADACNFPRFAEQALAG